MYSYPEIMGLPLVITMPQPAVGADYASVSVPTNVLWHLDSAIGTLTTSAVAGNRIAHLILENSTKDYLNAAQGPITASQTCILNWYLNAPQVLPVSLAYTEGIAGLPDTPLVEGEKIIFYTPARDGGDQWSTGYLKVRQWINPHG